MDLQQLAAAGGGRSAMSAIAKTGPGGATRSVTGHCLDVAGCAHVILTTGVGRARLGVPADVPLTNVHIFCKKEYYGKIANTIRRRIDDYLEASGK
jgi:hypothetical protein